jgi:serine/threonine-protein kinase
MGSDSAPSHDPFELVGTLLDGKHRVDRLVAVGGFGVVYAGHHLRLDVPIAIKVLKPLNASPEQRGDAIARFIEEARTTARLRHPHIAQILDTGVTESLRVPEGIAWMVLEWLDGDTLAADPIDDAARWPVTARVLALAEADARGGRPCPRSRRGASRSETEQ